MINKKIPQFTLLELSITYLSTRPSSKVMYCRVPIIFLMITAPATVTLAFIKHSWDTDLQNGISLYKLHARLLYLWICANPTNLFFISNSTLYRGIHYIRSHTSRNSSSLRSYACAEVFFLFKPESAFYFPCCCVWKINQKPVLDESPH